MMKTKNDWAFRFFNSPDYVDLYDDMTGPNRTKTEIDFCEQVIGWGKNDLILDAPCGAGRHSEILSKRSVRVVGLDFSTYLISQATQQYKESHDDLLYVRGLLQKLPFRDSSFHAAICLFSSFGYGEHESDNLDIVKEYKRVLKPGGKLLIDVMNRHFIIPRLNRVYESVRKGLIVKEERTITNQGRRLHNIIRVSNKHGEQRQYLYNPWLFNGFELSLLASQAGLKVIKVFGNFRGDEFTEKSERAMLLAMKEEH